MKRILLLIFSILPNLTINCMESGKCELSENVKLQLPEFFLATIQNKTNKNFVLMINNQVKFGIRPAQTTTRNIKINMKRAPEYTEAAEIMQKPMSRLRLLSNSDDIKFIQMDQNKIDGENFRESYHLKIVYSLFKLKNSYVAKLNTYLFNSENNDCCSVA